MWQHMLFSRILGPGVYCMESSWRSNLGDRPWEYMTQKSAAKLRNNFACYLACAFNIRRV
jgi:hypothetical protein